MGNLCCCSPDQSSVDLCLSVILPLKYPVQCVDDPYGHEGVVVCGSETLPFHWSNKNSCSVFTQEESQSVLPLEMNPILEVRPIS
ncbi:hypothetical protein DNTS_021792 [Danionella cerebrum]|uniref:Uncharacterized protein n=1 Tax=Danionella cerebrum TaxID=2873325 RepID=A0A553R858_9TELE|nr:hypothetical protein DNTS_021792 [Danionella translucida]